MNMLSRYKPVVLAAGNSNLEINTNNTSYAIVVGGSMRSSTTGRYIKWDDSISTGSNYYNPFSSDPKSNIIDLAASAKSILYYAEDGTTRPATGTSFAAPMVAATIGMMRKINPSITFDQLRSLITYSATIEKSIDGYGGTSSLFLGRDLESSSVNPGKVAGIRNLNVLNALVMAKNLPNYQVLARLHNIDDNLYLGNSIDLSYFGQTNVENYGSDKIFGIDGLSYGNYVNFSEYNSSGGCAFGYQIYRNQYVFDKIGGVSGISGTNIGTCGSGVFNYTMQYQY